MGDGWEVTQDWPKKTFVLEISNKEPDGFINALSGPLHSKVFTCGGRHQPPSFTVK